MGALFLGLVAALSVLTSEIAHSREPIPDMIEGVADVSDGDTLMIRGVTVRLHGIDAPETAQTCENTEGRRWSCGADAARGLVALVSNRPVRCQKAGRGTDVNGRMLGICTVGNVTINEEMVRRGLAWAFRRYAVDYVKLEDEARGRGKGIWQAPGTQTPWDYRTNAWDDALRTSPPGKPIKGNFKRRDGVCIYHTPWSRSWRSTKINEARGDRWFSDETEAIAAGCRAPRKR